MKAGDLLDLSGCVGVVRRIDRQARMAVVQLSRDVVIEIPDDSDRLDSKCRVLCNPGVDWPYLKLPDRPKLGIMVGFALRGRILDLFKDYVPTEFGHTGSVFLNPLLGLAYGDVLLGLYERSNIRIDIPREFLSVTEKAERVRAPQDRAHVYGSLPDGDDE